MENSIGDRIEEKYTRYLNCETDTLELTIEETIFILETDESLHYVEDLLQEAYKVILSEYKKVLKENEELKNDYENLSNSVVVKNYCIENSIPVQKVKDNIKKLEIKKEKVRGERDILERFAIEKSINSLQELLYGRNK